jgi:hypothetical protein
VHDYRDNSAHGYEWSGILTGLVGCGMVLVGYVLVGQWQWVTVIGWCNPWMNRWSNL